MKKELNEELQIQLDAACRKHCGKNMCDLSYDIHEEKITFRILKTIRKYCFDRSIAYLYQLTSVDIIECLKSIHNEAFEPKHEPKAEVDLASNLKRLKSLFGSCPQTEITMKSLGFYKAHDVTCPHCHTKAILTSSNRIYQKDFGNIYLCPRCKAFCGTHPGTTIPIGLPANGQERYFRKQTHKVFDGFWKQAGLPRKDAYKWLSARMGLRSEDTHIGLFSVPQCKRAIQIVMIETKGKNPW